MPEEERFCGREAGVARGSKLSGGVSFDEHLAPRWIDEIRSRGRRRTAFKALTRIRSDLALLSRAQGCRCGTSLGSMTDFQITFDAADPKGLGEFWCSALGYRREEPPEYPTWEEQLTAWGVPSELWNSRNAIVDPDGVRPRIFFQQVLEPKAGKNRLHLDLRAAPGLEGNDRMAVLETECARLQELGATRVERYEPAPDNAFYGWIIMQDPEGNEFCLD